MGSFSLMHWVIVLLVVMLLFGGGRISGLMGDVAKGIKSFKKGMAELLAPYASYTESKHWCPFDDVGCAVSLLTVSDRL